MLETAVMAGIPMNGPLNGEKIKRVLDGTKGIIREDALQVTCPGLIASSKCFADCCPTAVTRR